MQSLSTTVDNSDVFRSMPDAHFIIDKDGKVLSYLGGGSRDDKLDGAELEGQCLAGCWPESTINMLKQAARRTAKTRDVQAFSATLDKQRYELRIAPKGRQAFLLIVRRLEAGDSAIATSLDRDTVDDVTGLTMRDTFMAELDDVLTEAGLREVGAAVLCLDIDHFTRINDTLGRSVGDAVLRVTAKRIERCIRDHDHMARVDDQANHNDVTRISGDEFVLLLRDVGSREDVATVADRLREAFDEPISVDGHQVPVCPSIGIAQFPIDGSNATDLVQNARVALGEAKLAATRIGKAFFSNTMKFRALENIDVRNELVWAIENDQLELHYLPRIELDSGHVAGLEALLRWVHPLRGIVPLSEVIPLAEATGLMLDIGERVLAKACRQARRWQDELDECPPVSVNLGESEFFRDDIAALVRRSIAEAELTGTQVELEIAEKLLCRSQRADSIVEALTDAGAAVVIDDFGSSRSSVAHLTSLPLTGIKIDRSFVDGACEPGPSQSTCAAIIAMCRQLGVTVIAEGVEDALQVEFLREAGCDAVQGFFYTEPLPADDVPAFMATCAEAASESLIVDLNTMRQKIANRSAG